MINQSRGFPLGALFKFIAALFCAYLMIVSPANMSHENDHDIFVVACLGFFLCGLLGQGAVSSARPKVPAFPTSVGEPRWRSVSDAQLAELTKASVEYSEVGKIIYMLFGNGFSVTLFWILAAAVYLLKISVVLSVILFLMPMVAKACVQLMRVDEVGYPYDTIKLMIPQIRALREAVAKFEGQMSLDIQVCVKEHQNVETCVQAPFIADEVRVMVRWGGCNPESWLCAMFSFSTNKYKESKLPYTYFVLVVDKARMQTDALMFEKTYQMFLEEVEKHYARRLICEKKDETDNVVILLRKHPKAYRTYVTVEKDVHDLVEAANMLAQTALR